MTYTAVSRRVRSARRRTQNETGPTPAQSRDLARRYAPLWEVPKRSVEHTALLDSAASEPHRQRRKPLS